MRTHLLPLLALTVFPLSAQATGRPTLASLRAQLRAAKESYGGDWSDWGETAPTPELRKMEQQLAKLERDKRAGNEEQAEDGDGEQPSLAKAARQHGQQRGRKDAPAKLDTSGWNQLAGADGAVAELRQILETPLSDYQKLGIKPPSGILLKGPPGTGKTTVGRILAQKMGAKFFLVNGPELFSKWSGEGEKNLRQVFADARKATEKGGKAVIFFDEIDGVAGRRGDSSDWDGNRMVTQLNALLDGVEGRAGITVIGATNRPNDVDPALRRPGRFEQEVTLGLPDEKGRRDILALKTATMPLAPDVKLEVLAARTPGFSGADIEKLTREAGRLALTRMQTSKTKPELTLADFTQVLDSHTVVPTALREANVERPNVHWSDIGGQEQAKNELQLAVEGPLKNPAAFARFKLSAPKGVLLYGPPGTGKTLLAKAAATETGANFIYVKATDLRTKWYAESSGNVAKLFERAQDVAPAVIFIDEIDGLIGKRGGGNGDSAEKENDDIITAFLEGMDGLNTKRGVTVIAATNRPDALDNALLRPGRFGKQVFVGLPDEAGRAAILKIHLADRPVSKNLDVEKLAALADRFSGDDLKALVDDAALRAMTENAEGTITMSHLTAALKERKPSVTPEMEKLYAAFQQSAHDRR